MKHLWEINHPYYCNLGNYYSNEPGDEFKTWQGFYENYKDADFDMNLIFRWDWEALESDDKGEPIWKDDIYYRDGRLEIFWMGQRKGLYRFSVIQVCKADEPEIIAFLKPRYLHLLKLWEPFNETN